MYFGMDNWMNHEYSMYKTLYNLYIINLQILEAEGDPAAGGHVYTFTDGEENEEPYIRDVRDEVLTKSVIIHGLLVDFVADNHDLVTLAVDSGGEYCIYTDTGVDFYDCLKLIGDQTSDDMTLEVSIMSVFVFILLFLLCSTTLKYYIARKNSNVNILILLFCYKANKETLFASSKFDLVLSYNI